MRIRVDFTTSYRYAAPASGVIQRLRVQPHDGWDQHVLRWRVDVDADGALRTGRDVFGNITHLFTADGPLTALTLRVTGEVETGDSDGVVRGFAEPLPTGVFLRTTALTAPDPAIVALAAATAPDANVLDRLHALLIALYQRRLG